MFTFCPRRGARLAAPLITALLVTTPPASAVPTETKHSILRLVASDAATGRLTIHHAATGRTVFEATLPAPASNLVALGDGRHVAAAVASQNAVQLVDSGTWTELHGDHRHSHVAPPTLVGPALAASRPSHVVGHGDDVVVYGDGDGVASRYSLAKLAAGQQTAAVTRAAFPHHGVGLALGDTLLMSAAPSAGGRPDAVTQTDASGATLRRFGGCPGLHGETSGPDWAAFGCADGTLLLAGTPLAARKLAYPAAAGALRVGTWSRSASGRHLVGALGTTGVLIIDRRTGTQHLTRVDGLLHAVKTDPASATAFALTRDGRLHRIALATGIIASSAQFLAPFGTPAGAPSPKLAVAPGRVAVSDPARRRLLVARSTDLRIVRGFGVGVVPGHIAFTGAPVLGDDH